MASFTSSSGQPHHPHTLSTLVSCLHDRTHVQKPHKGTLFFYYHHCITFAACEATLRFYIHGSERKPSSPLCMLFVGLMEA
jgi:hypothetical protein